MKWSVTASGASWRRVFCMCTWTWKSRLVPAPESRQFNPLSRLLRLNGTISAPRLRVRPHGFPFPSSQTDSISPPLSQRVVQRAGLAAAAGTCRKKAREVKETNRRVCFLSGRGDRWPRLSICTCCVYCSIKTCLCAASLLIGFSNEGRKRQPQTGGELRELVVKNRRLVGQNLPMTSNVGPTDKDVIIIIFYY